MIIGWVFVELFGSWCRCTGLGPNDLPIRSSLIQRFESYSLYESRCLWSLINTKVCMWRTVEQPWLLIIWILVIHKLIMKWLLSFFMCLIVFIITLFTSFVTCLVIDDIFVSMKTLYLLINITSWLSEALQRLSIAFALICNNTKQLAAGSDFM